MNRTSVMWSFVRADPVARPLAIASGVVAWFAATWVSLAIACLLPLLGVALWWRYRQVGAELPADGDDLL